MPPDTRVTANDHTATAASWFARASNLFLGAEPRRRLRITQWSVAALVYASSTLVVKLALRPGPAVAISYLWWCAFLAILLICVYLALRTGWSERFADPALTTTQVIIGVIGVAWAYVLCGPARGMTIYPLLLIFAFGAFSLSWRRIMWLTVLTLVSLIATVAVLGATRPGGLLTPHDPAALRVDQLNVLMIIVVLPAVSVLAARLSSLRRKLRAQHTALAEAMEEVQRLATQDNLTGLVNRRYMEERLAEEQRHSERHDNPFSVIIIDIDNFKGLNDTHGHAFGDQVLQAFADRAMTTLRASDLIARWGGDEFLALLRDTSAAQAQTIIQRLLARMATIPHGSCPPVTFSAGVTENRPGESIEDVVARADAAMYEAKESGSNRVRMKPPAPASVSGSSTR